MEGHAAMDMTIGGEGSLWDRLRSKQASTSVSHIFVMEWAAVIRDIVLGLLIAGAVAAWVPNRFWRHLFFIDHRTLAKIWGPLIGPIVSLLSFVCSIGNVPLAGVLWNGGISFGGAFIFADLIILLILNIYRKGLALVSVSSECAHHAACPVVIIRPPVRQPAADPRNALVGVSGTRGDPSMWPTEHG